MIIGKDKLACHSSFMLYPQQRGQWRGHDAYPQIQEEPGGRAKFRPAVLSVLWSPHDYCLPQSPCLQQMHWTKFNFAHAPL